MEAQAGRWDEGISRQDLFTAGRHVHDEDTALSAYLLVCAWGAGSKARPVWRCAQPLTHTQAAGKLLAARDDALDRGAAPAYWRMLGGGRNSIPGFGPAFFSKWLYFTTYDGWPTDLGHPPLIFDQRVANALGLRASALRSHRAYEAYLNLVEQLSSELSEYGTERTQPHSIEHALFILGGSLKQ